MKPFLLLCADPPVSHVAAGLERELRVVAVGTTPSALTTALTTFDRRFRARELIPIDPGTLERSGLSQALNTERKLPLRELLIRGAVGYVGIPDTAILYAESDLIHLAEPARRANRRPACIGLRDGKASQTEILFDLGYRDVVMHRDPRGACHVVATDQDLSRPAAEPTGAGVASARLPELRCLMLSLLASDDADPA